MIQTIALVLIFLPVVAGLALLDIGGRILFDAGLWQILLFLWQAGIGDGWVMLGVTAFFGTVILFTAGALYSTVWSNAWFIGSTVKPHVFLGQDLDHGQHYVAQGDPHGPTVTVWAESGSDLPTTGFGTIYLSHLLVKFPMDADKWQQMRTLTTRNLVWPIIVAPIVYFFGQAIVWAGLVLAHDHGLPLDQRFAAAGDEGTLLLALFAEIGIWPLSVCGLITLVLVPLSIRTGKWAGEIYQSFGREAGGPVPKAQPLPEAVEEGAILQGEIVESGGWRSSSGKTRRSYDTFLMRFDAPFEPSVYCGFYFRESPRRKEFCDYLEERMDAGLPIKVRVVGKYDLAIVPLDADGSEPPDGIGDEIAGRN
jgi:hypothetical protein